MSETRHMSLDTMVSVSQDQLSCTLDDETVLMSVENGQYYYLNKVGSRIWSCLATPQRIADLCAVLLAAYDVEPTQCEHEVLAFLDTLYSHKLIQVAS